MMMAQKSNSEPKFLFRLTADHRVYEDLKNSGQVKLRYAKNCKRCKRHRRNLRVSSKYDLTKEPLTPLTLDMGEDPELHFMTVPRLSKRDWDPHLTLTSPVEWETSPLVDNSIVNTDKTNPNEITEKAPKTIENNEANVATPPTNNSGLAVDDQGSNDTPTDVQGDKAPEEEYPSKSAGSSQTRNNSSRRSRSESKRNAQRTRSHKSSIKVDNEKNDDAAQPFLTVNNAQNLLMDAQNHNNLTAPGADKSNSASNEGIKCRYCLMNNSYSQAEPLISPCQCCGTSKYVHKSCLEKWLTLRNLDACEVCKTHYNTKWVHRKLSLLQFPSMKKHDVILLLATITMYITLIFQMLGAIYISLVAPTLPTMVIVVTLVGLALGLFWLLPCSIALTIIVYTSDYWRAWRNANKRKVLVFDGEHVGNVTENSATYIPEDLSMAIAV